MQYKFNFFITKLGDWWDHDFCLVSGAEKWCGKQPTCGHDSIHSFSEAAAAARRAASVRKDVGGGGGGARDGGRGRQEEEGGEEER